VLSGGRCPAALASLPDRELSSWIHHLKRKGTALARLSLRD